MGILERFKREWIYNKFFLCYDTKKDGENFRCDNQHSNRGQVVSNFLYISKGKSSVKKEDNFLHTSHCNKRLFITTPERESWQRKKKCFKSKWILLSVEICDSKSKLLLHAIVVQFLTKKTALWLWENLNFALLWNRL
jgi:hypothetical protein